MTDTIRDLLISLSSHMAYMQGQLEARHELDDPEDFYWYRESVLLRQKVTDALADEPAVPEGMEPVAVVQEPSDAELVGKLVEAANGAAAMGWDHHAQDAARKAASAVLARWGNPVPVPLTDGEVAELVAWLREIGDTIQPSHLAEHQRYKRAAELLERQVMVPVSVSDALIKAECALSDIAEGEPMTDEGDPLQWAERRCADTLAIIRPTMRQHKIRTSEWPPLPLPSGEPSDQELYDYWIATSPELGCADPVGFARAVLARWGCPAPVPTEGEVAELVEGLRLISDGMSAIGHDSDSWFVARAAKLLQRQALVPVSVSERLPEPSTKVLAHYFNDLGKGRTICAIWVPAKTQTDSYGEDDFTEYDEETDNFYWPEGWYEAIENWDDFGWVKVNEGKVVYWQPLPKWPAHALPLPEVK